jgi:hypothetical protein
MSRKTIKRGPDKNPSRQLSMKRQIAVVRTLEFHLGWGHGTMRICS